MSNEVKQKNGVQESIPSIQLYEYSQICGATDNKTYPKEFCLNTEEMGTCVKTQGTVGACVACATSTALEALKLRSLLNLPKGIPITEETLKKEVYGNDEISEGYTYGTCRYDNSRIEGMIPTVCLDYLKKEGTVPKKYFNYLEEMPDIKETAKKFPELKDIAKKYRISSYVTFNQARTTKDILIKDALMEYRTPLVCIAPKKFGESHCICLVGWDDSDETYYIKNSWGEDWGDKGVGKVKKTDITQVYFLMDEEIQLPFSDVKTDDWFYSAVKHVYMSDLMNGRTETTFDPNAPMTRAEIATVLSRLMKKIDERFDNLNKILEVKYGEN